MRGSSPYFKYDYLSDKEKTVLAAFVSQNDWEGAEKYLQALERKLYERQTTGIAQQAKETSEKHPALGAVTNVASSFAAPLAYIATGAQNIKNVITGEYEPTFKK